MQTESAHIQLYGLCVHTRCKSLSDSLPLYNQKQSITVMPQQSVRMKYVGMTQRQQPTQQMHIICIFYSMITRIKYTVFTGR
jgi:hypothetical protein